MNIYLIRHTKVGVEQGICYGHSDVPLASSFEVEFEKVRAKLPIPQETIIYSSPLTRCRELAEYLAETPVQCDDRLIEMNFGLWETQRWDAIDDAHLKVWMNDFVNQTCPQGESFHEVSQRVLTFWQDVQQSCPPQVFLVTHAGIIRVLLSYILGFPLKHAFRLAIDFGGVSKIQQGRYGPVVDYINR